MGERVERGGGIHKDRRCSPFSNDYNPNPPMKTLLYTSVGVAFAHPLSRVCRGCRPEPPENGPR